MLVSKHKAGATMNKGFSAYILLAVVIVLTLLIVSTVPILVRADASLSLTKSATEEDFDSSGDLLHYTLVATNTSTADETLTDVSITDSKLGTLNCTPTQPATLAPGGTLSCTGTYTTTQVDVDTGNVQNSASVAGNPPTGPNVTGNASADIPAIQNPQISLTKGVTEVSFNFSGASLHYTLVATNTGNVTLADATISDPKLATLNCTPTQPATLAPGGTLSCTGTYTTTQADVNAGNVHNSATAEGTPPTGPNVTGNASADIPAIQDPEISLTKDATETSFDAAGDTLHYTMVATNSGNVTLSNVSITDPKLSLPICTPVQPATLAPGETLSCTGTYTTTQNDVDFGKVENTATAEGQPPTGPNVTDTASADIPADPKENLTLTKSSTETSYKAVGNVLHYTLVATNTGNVTLTQVVISDAKLGTLTCAQPAILAPGALLTCTGNYTIKPADLDAKSVTNTANSIAMFGPKEVFSNPATHTVFGATYTVTPTSGLLTFEDGTTDSFTIKLDKKPSANVVINLTSNDTSEAVVSPTTLTFTPGEWTPSLTKTVTVQGVNDNLADGPQPFTINMSNVSSGPDYSGVNPPSVTGTNGDNDTAGLTVSPLSGLVTTEGKTSAKIQVKLNTQPTADVTITFSSSKPTEGTVAPASLVIKPADWNLVKEVTVTGVDDKVPDGNQNYQININTASSDGKYNSKTAAVSATNRDAPTIAFTSPVPTGQIYDLTNFVPFLLKVLQDGSEPITRVRLYRWDAVKKIHVNVGEILNPPYQIIYDPAKNGNILNPGFNQFFAVAYNAANVASENIHIWVYKQGNTYTLYLPIVIKNR